MSERKRCAAAIRVRDTYRYTGRGKNGFELHYTDRQCKRRAAEGDLCTQHATQEQIGWRVRRFHELYRS